MTFSSIMTFICVGYVLAYSGTVIYDLFIAKEPVELTPKVEEVEIDISDEASDFIPISIDKDGHFYKEQPTDERGEEDEDEKEEDVEEENEEQAEDNPGKNPSEKSEEKSYELSEQKELESEVETRQQSEEDAEKPEEAVSASDIEASAREQAETWMAAQVGLTTDTEEEKDSQPEAVIESQTTPETEPEEEAESSESPQATETSAAIDQQQAVEQDEEPAIETGAIEMSELSGMLEVLAEKGDDSPLGRVIRIWNVDAA